MGGSTSGNAIPGIYLNGGADLIHNTFENLLPSDIPDVRATATTNDTIIARNNSFLEPGIAILSNGPIFDARENWWGDSTGPYHANLNPNGLGTEVGNGVEFIPWLTMHPDSMPDTNGTGVGEQAELPSDFSLYAARFSNREVTIAEIDCKLCQQKSARSK